jgi:hypothetical protein
VRFWPLLADSAQGVGGKLYVLGGGWNVTGPAPAPCALAGIVELEWDEANQPKRLRAELLTEDGHPVMVATPTGDRAVEIEVAVEVGRPPGTRVGTLFNVPIAINLGPLPIPPGGRYVWRFAIDGDQRDEWRLPFTTRPAEGAGAPTQQP